VLELGIDVRTNRNVVEYDGAAVLLECTYTGRRETLPAATVIAVTSRLPNDELVLSLDESAAALATAGIVSVTAIGDCLAPSTIAAAVYAGHRYAREFDRPPSDEAAFRRELTDLASS
jgi:dimethylamine/trimethylamine dehydrogenase